MTTSLAQNDIDEKVSVFLGSRSTPYKECFPAVSFKRAKKIFLRRGYHVPHRVSVRESESRNLGVAGRGNVVPLARQTVPLEPQQLVRTTGGPRRFSLSVLTPLPPPPAGVCPLPPPSTVRVGPLRSLVDHTGPVRTLHRSAAVSRPQADVRRFPRPRLWTIPNIRSKVSGL